MNMKDIGLDLVITDGLASITDPTTSEEEFKKACHPLKTDRCPSIPQLEKIAAGRGAIMQRFHANKCAYCRKSVAMFREMLEIKPWPAQACEALQQAWQAAKEGMADISRSPAYAGGPGERVASETWRRVDAVILQPDLSVRESASMDLCKLDFVEANVLMTVRLKGPIQDVGSDGLLELAVVADLRIFGPYTIKVGEEAKLLLCLFQDEVSQWEKQISVSSTLPFQFVLRSFSTEVTEEKETGGI